jgi:general stress protein 26
VLVSRLLARLIDHGFPGRDANAKASLSITARGSRDAAKAAEIWKATDAMWWQEPDDPNVCVLGVTPFAAELWDGPASQTMAVFEFVMSQLTGAQPNLGENRKVTVRM